MGSGQGQAQGRVGYRRDATVGGRWSEVAVNLPLLTASTDNPYDLEFWCWNPSLELLALDRYSN